MLNKKRSFVIQIASHLSLKFFYAISIGIVITLPFSFIIHVIKPGMGY